ncbi:MAG: PDGLE domain-containing protein [Candidatus Omnitrophica bacterium]|nr:PDGLE domain-containing protein [Candidatus Omnitrophota bacterium]
MKLTNKLWIGLGILAIFSPLGLLLPEHFKAGSAWGEWGADEMQKLVGYIPQGLEKLSSLWNAPMPDYAFKGWEGKGLSQLSFAYIISAIVGIGLIIIVVMVVGRLLVKKEHD